MLLRLGIASTIYRDRRAPEPQDCPTAGRGQASTPTQAQHELVIANDNLAVFAERVGFADHEKQRG